MIVPGRMSAPGATHRIGAELRAVAEESSELRHAGLDGRAVMQDPDALIVELVAVIRHHAAGLAIDALAEDRIPDEIEMGELRALEQEARFELGRRADDAILLEMDAAAQIGARRDKAGRVR